MSAVLDRSELEQSPLADLHLLANELGVDGFRRLRKEELIDAIVARQAGEEAVPAEAEPEPEPAEAPRRARRGRRSVIEEVETAEAETAEEEDEDEG
ncbi:MAG: Rho termination factor N-terminal domain-containing protein, partial [Solirubrobacteraceae bacterium]